MAGPPPPPPLELRLEDEERELYRKILQEHYALPGLSVLEATKLGEAAFFAALNGGIAVAGGESAGFSTKPDSPSVQQAQPRSRPSALAERSSGR